MAPGVAGLECRRWLIAFRRGRRQERLRTVRGPEEGTSNMIYYLNFLVELGLKIKIYENSFFTNVKISKDFEDNFWNEISISDLSQFSG